MEAFRPPTRRRNDIQTKIVKIVGPGTHLTHAAFVQLGGDPEVRKGCVDQVGGLYCILMDATWMPLIATYQLDALAVLKM